MVIKTSTNTKSDNIAILIVHNFYKIPGGEDTVVENEKKMLEEHGHKVILYTRNNSELKNMKMLQKIFLPFTTIFNIKTYKDVKNIIQTYQINLIHVHNTLNLISPSVYYAALKCKKPVVQTIHNYRLLCPGATFYRDGHICEDCMDNGLLCAVKHNCYRNSKLQTLACVINTKFHRLMGVYGKISYICLTEFNKNKLVKFKQIRPEKVYVKPNFIHENISIIPDKGRKNQFAYVGRLDHLKGIDILLKAWKKVELELNCELVICGIGPMEDWCKTYIKNNALHKIKMLGYVPNNKAKEIISISKALIFPSRWYEGFPMSIAEAFSAGTPVVCTDLGNAGSLVTEGITGSKFKLESSEDLVKAIKRIAGYENIYETTKTEYEKKYTESINYKTLIEIYQEQYHE
ncbi:glycosyltransferase family 4 protein [Diplocloster hominis]|uniref:glycosyltransferase family 4 protein n=1 Tax=Diplocloster hominis TaxID=3079010 RepID=UPI0031B9F637